MPILAIVLVGFYTKRVPACAPKITLVVHVILYSISKFLPLNVHYLYVLSVLFPVDLALMLLIGKLKPRATDFILEDSKAVDLTPWKYVKPGSADLLHPDALRLRAVLSDRSGSIMSRTPETIHLFTL